MTEMPAPASAARPAARAVIYTCVGCGAKIGEESHDANCPTQRPR